MINGELPTPDQGLEPEMQQFGPYERRISSLGDSGVSVDLWNRLTGHNNWRREQLEDAAALDPEKVERLNRELESGLAGMEALKQFVPNIETLVEEYQQERNKSR